MITPIHTVLQDDLNALTNWANVWQMEFNVSKCKILQVSTFTKHNYSYSMYSAISESVESHSYTWVCRYIIAKLLWSPHINSLCNKANRLIGFYRETFTHPADKHLVLPCLEYCASIWDPSQTSLSLIHPLEMVQHILC